MTSHNAVAVHPTMPEPLLAPRRLSSLAARRTGSTWTVFPTTLLLQLLSDGKISDRLRTEGGWFDVGLKQFFPSHRWHSAEPFALHLLSARVHVWRREGREMQPCRFARIRHCSILQRVRDRVVPQPPLPPSPHPALAPPTRSHVRYARTPCLLECYHGNGAPAAQMGRRGMMKSAEGSRK